MYKNNCGDGTNINGRSPLQTSCNLTGKYQAIGNYSYYKSYVGRVKRSLKGIQVSTSYWFLFHEIVLLKSW
jgi:hypothetical protein